MALEHLQLDGQRLGPAHRAVGAAPQSAHAAAVAERDRRVWVVVACSQKVDGMCCRPSGGEDDSRSREQQRHGGFVQQQRFISACIYICMQLDL